MAVSMMTIHTAKGLEYKNVFIAGFSEKIFPSERALDENMLEEERRVAYVAVTRAKENLFITSSKGYSIDYKFQKTPSRFLKELNIDIKDFTNNFIASKFGDKVNNNLDLVEGDKVKHLLFGSGVVIRITGPIAEIAFPSPHGVKSLLKDHKSIESDD
jgi:DNA helicase-2/ATP-dependent DNA helicase PcrA